MSKGRVCPVCGEGHLEPVAYSECVKVGRRTVQVAGLMKSVCSSCGSSLVPPDAQAHNLSTMESALMQTQGAVTGGFLRKLRETWGLSQREASRAFGAGESSFAKWESGQTRLSTPAALLVQVALKVPGVMPYLAYLAGVRIRSPGGSAPSAPEIDLCAGVTGDLWLDPDAANLSMFRADGKSPPAKEHGPLRSSPSWRAPKASTSFDNPICLEEQVWRMAA